MRPRIYFDGQSLPSLIKQVRQTPLPDVPDQAPVYRWPKADKARLRAKEYVRRYLRMVRRSA